MSVSQQDVRAQVAAMEQDLADAQRARKRTSRTKFAGSLIVALVIVAFGLQVVNQVKNLHKQLNAPSETNEGQTVAQELFYKRLGGQETVDQTVRQARTIVTTRLRETAEAAQNDPQIRALAKGLWEDVAVPALREEVDKQGPKVMGMVKEAGDEWMKELQATLEAKVQEHLSAAVERHRTQLAEGTELNEERVDEIISKLRETSEAAATEMIAKRVKEMQPEIDAIIEARNQIVSQTPPDIEDVHPVYALAKLLGYKLIELPVRPVDSPDEDSSD